MQRQFLRAPLVYTRVSSNFSPRRFHPKLKVWRPHNGVDYAAPTGTPVRATANGTVKKASFSKPNGNYVFLRHPGNYETRYLHFSRIAKGMRPGVKVEQGDVIGYVGSTGYSTGPHLHYELLANGKHQNPRTISFPEAKTLSGSELEHFKQSMADLKTRLEIAQRHFQIQNSEFAQASN